MLDKLKELWSRYKVQVTLAGGVLVVATVFGTCYYNPAETTSNNVTNDEVIVETTVSTNVDETTGVTVVTDTVGGANVETTVSSETTSTTTTVE